MGSWGRDQGNSDLQGRESRFAQSTGSWSRDQGSSDLHGHIALSMGSWGRDWGNSDLQGRESRFAQSTGSWGRDQSTGSWGRDQGSWNSKIELVGIRSCQGQGRLYLPLQVCLSETRRENLGQESGLNQRCFVQQEKNDKAGLDGVLLSLLGLLI